MPFVAVPDPSGKATVTLWIARVTLPSCRMAAFSSRKFRFRASRVEDADYEKQGVILNEYHAPMGSANYCNGCYH
jgi:hypothetical protein